MTRRIPGRFMRHKVLIEKLTDITPTGDVFEPPREVRAAVDQKTRKTPTATGEEIVSSTDVVVDPENEVPVGSYVTVWPGTIRARRAPVVSSRYLDDVQMPSHTVLYLG